MTWTRRWRWQTQWLLYSMNMEQIMKGTHIHYGVILWCFFCIYGLIVMSSSSKGIWLRLHKAIKQMGSPGTVTWGNHISNQPHLLLVNITPGFLLDMKFLSLTLLGPWVDNTKKEYWFLQQCQEKARSCVFKCPTSDIWVLLCWDCDVGGKRFLQRTPRNPVPHCFLFYGNVWRNHKLYFASSQAHYYSRRSGDSLGAHEYHQR